MARSRSVRTVTDPAVLAALAHPTRRRLMDVMKTSDASTVGMLADRLGIAVGSVSHHLKVLHKADLVTPAPELARDRRERWWRLVDAAIRWTGSAFDDSPTTEAIVAAAASIGLERQIELARQALSPAETDSALARAAFSTDAWISLSGAELDELAGEIQQVLNRWRDREIDDPDEERGSVFVFARGFQAQP